MGQPTPKGLGLQPAANALAEEAAWFHNALLMPIITVITLFVLALILWIAFRYRAAANPTPSRTSHNTLLEIVWTAVPCLILVVIAVPSFQLLYDQYEDLPADVTIKTTGYQWYWSYEYPDHGEISFDSVMLSNAEADAKGHPHLLGTDTYMVVPAGKRVKLLITAADVLHSWAMPALKVKMDAVPGRINELQFNAPERPGFYYGQCSELCGIRHGFMPITMKVVDEAEFAVWVENGGTMPVQEAAAPQPTDEQFADAGAALAAAGQ